MKLIPRKEPKAAGAAKSKPAKKVLLPSSARFALLIGDEGAILIFIEKNSVQKRFFAANCSAESISEFDNILSKHPKAPLDVFLDTLDQTYIQQTLPPVSSFSTAKLMKRRVNREFPNTPLKGAILLDRQNDERKEWNFLMVALEQNAALKEWFTWLEQIPNHCRGIYLMPLESEYLLKLLIQYNVVDSAAHPWCFIITHNKVSGFRQIVLKNGKMTFTRLGQPLSDSDPAVAAGVIEQEGLSTIEYLKRLSFKNFSELNLTIIASDDILKLIDTHKFNAHAVQMITPHTLAMNLNIQNSTQPSDRFGDVIITAILTSAKKHKLRFLTPIITKIHQSYQLLLGARVGAAFAGLVIIYMIGSFAYDYWETSSQISDLEKARISKEAILAQKRADTSKLTADIDRLSDTVTIYDKLAQDAHTPIPFLNSLSALMPTDVSVASIEWKIVDDAGKKGAAAPPPPTPTPASAANTAKPPAFALGNVDIDCKLSVEFKNINGDTNKLKEKSEAFLNNLKEHFPGYDIQYINIIGLTKETDKMQFDLSKTQTAAITTAASADITLKGKVILSEAQQPEKGASK